jgi:hypothetical protein
MLLNARSCGYSSTGAGGYAEQGRGGHPATTYLSSSRRVLARKAVDGFADEVGVPGVAGVLLDEVQEYAAEVGAFAATGGVGTELVQPARAECFLDDGTGAGD